MSYLSQYYQIDLQDSIAHEFTNSRGEVDDMMAGLHEIRVRMAEKEYNLRILQATLEKNEARLRQTHRGASDARAAWLCCQWDSRWIIHTLNFERG